VASHIGWFSLSMSWRPMIGSILIKGGVCMAELPPSLGGPQPPKPRDGPQKKKEQKIKYFPLTPQQFFFPQTKYSSSTPRCLVTDSLYQVHAR
jgi:hypothetical protein